MRRRTGFAASLVLALASTTGLSQETDDAAAAASHAYLERVVLDVIEPREKAFFDGVDSWERWQALRAEEHAALWRDLGLEGLELGGPLERIVTGTEEFEDVVVEKVHFQSSPGLYVTGNLYLPKKRAGKVPAILYVCGHGKVARNGVSYGNKVHYQHHGVGFAKHGFACLAIDTIQLGEIEGIHHGTHNLGKWDWVDRGYTPAGIEAWNSMRAIDLLCADERIDASRIGVTGRSGGGAYSWWTAALDERVKAAAPVAGITDLRDHVVDDCVSGHCDCMYFVNHRGVGYSRVAALVAPRPLLLVNTDRDPIFPLDGVVRTIEPAFRIYELAGKRENVGVAFGPGDHDDTPDIQLPVLRWMLAHLQPDFAGEVDVDAFSKKPFEPERLKVFATLPADENVTTVQDRRLPAVAMPTTMAAEGWDARKVAIMEFLDRWPLPETTPSAFKETSQEVRGGVESIEVAGFGGGDSLGWRAEVSRSAARPSQGVVIAVEPESGERTASNYPKSWGVPTTDDETTKRVADGLGVVRFYPSGTGTTEFVGDAKAATQRLRAFYLTGVTLPMLRTRDVRTDLESVLQGMSLAEVAAANTFVVARADAVTPTLIWLATNSPFDLQARLDLRDWKHDQTTWIGIARVMDPRELVLVAAERNDVRLIADDEDRAALETLADSIGRERFRLSFEEADATKN